MSFAQQIIADKTASLELMKAYLDDETPVFAYVVIRQSDLNALKKKEGLMALPDNSLVIHSGYGHDIPDEIEQYVFAEYEKLLKVNQTN